MAVGRSKGFHLEELIKINECSKKWYL